MNSKVAIEVVFPICVVVLSGAVRTIVRGGQLRQEDYHLGLDLTLAGMAAVAAYYVEFSKRIRLQQVTNTQTISDALDAIYLFGGIGVGFFVALLITHQKTICRSCDDYAAVEGSKLVNEKRNAPRHI
jgi:hypothetical protein